MKSVEMHPVAYAWPFRPNDVGKCRSREHISSPFQLPVPRNDLPTRRVNGSIPEEKKKKKTTKRVFVDEFATVNKFALLGNWATSDR